MQATNHTIQVALILLFVGVKMTAEYFHFEVGSLLSLSVIIGLLVAGTAASIVRNRFVAAAQTGAAESKSED